MKKKLDIKNRRVHVLLVVVLAIVIYSNTFNVPFIFDDFLYIANNDIVKDLRHFIEPSKTVNALSPDTLVNYTFRSRFIGYLTFAINHKLSGMDVRGYHILNLIIHIFNALLVYCLVMLTLTLTLRIHDTRYKMPDMEKHLFTLIYCFNFCLSSGTDPGCHLYLPKICLAGNIFLSVVAGDVYQIQDPRFTIHDTR
ncbi:MAG: hypothetical protein HY754_08955 [Nitrospirae bacterium]|nr:hypothetical protein [Nitrospirota bacterium]